MKNAKATPRTTAIETGRSRAVCARTANKPALADPYFFDPDFDEELCTDEALPQDVLETICAAMTQTGIDPAIIHAFRKTGCLLTEQNVHFFTESELAEWTEAINEFPLITHMIQ